MKGSARKLTGERLTKRRRFSKAVGSVLALGVCVGALCAPAGEDKPVRGLYLTSGCFGERRTTDTIHYAKQAGLNAVVLHVKDPRGHIFWKSNNALVKEMDAVRGGQALAKALSRYNENGIRTIAKIDTFQDTLLARHKPDWAVQKGDTGQPWEDRKKLCWTNPYDTRVWDHVIALAKEAAGLGFDEVQFDYIRFPSDGDMSAITYPRVLEGKSKLETIGAFLERAKSQLKPLGVDISVDLFGFVAWKTDDFGVGQRLEEIAPHVDAICPMLYPSHFPAGFLGKKDPSDHPKEIMYLSMQRLRERTTVELRPWVQGFWYEPDEILAQLEGIEEGGVKNWLVWNPASNYSQTFAALEKRLATPLSPPKYYASLDDLAGSEPREIRSNGTLVHRTDYADGRTVLSLEPPHGGRLGEYGTPRALLATLNPAVMDRILVARGIDTGPEDRVESKIAGLVSILCRDLGVRPNAMRAEPIYIDWRGDCRFSRVAPAQQPAAPPGQKPEPEPIPEVRTEQAPPKEGFVPGKPLSQDPPAGYTSLPSFGRVTWTVRHLPWVEEGPYAGISGMALDHTRSALYLAGGFIPGGDGSSEPGARTSRWVRRYDLATGEWQNLPDLPARREYVRGVIAQDAFYVMGGGCTNKEGPYRAFAEVFRMDLANPTAGWRPAGALSVPRTHMAVGACAGYLVVAGGNEYSAEANGYHASTIRAATDVYDLAAPEKGWQQRAAMPSGPRGWSAAVSAQGQLFVFGGITFDEESQAVPVQETLCYDPALDQWREATPPPLAISGWAGDLFDGRYAILAGGFDRTQREVGEADRWSDLLWAYDTLEDRWLRVDGALPVGAVFNDPGVAVIDDTVYVIGAEGPKGSHYDYFLAGRITEE